MPIAAGVRAALVSAAVLATACSPSASPSSPSTPSPAVSAAPSTKGFVSGRVTSLRFGWSMELPPGEWEYRAASADWPPHTYPAPGASYTDNFELPGESFPAIDVSTLVLPADQTSAEFITDLDAGTVSLGCTVESTEEVTIDGAAGRLQRQSCASGMETAWEALVFDGDRVYLIYWIGLSDAAATEEPMFREVLASFTFAP